MPGPAARIDLRDPGAFGSTRREILRSAGPVSGRSLLYAMGLAEGWCDAELLRRCFEGATWPTPGCFGPAPILFVPDSSDLSSRFTGTLVRSPEAALQLESFGEPCSPSCFVSAGYAAGWFSALLGEELLVLETRCRARGEPVCSFEARRSADWEGHAAEQIALLREYLDWEAIQALSGREHPTGDAGPMLGRFDPLSPAAHIWGPVLILPYSGGEDSEDALSSVERDIGAGHVRVVVVDLTGARIDPIEASGLARVLDRAEAMGLETILVGLDRSDTPPFREPRGGLAMPLQARDIIEGIALGFQLCQASPGAH